MTLLLATSPSQKVLGWFGGYGLKGTVGYLTANGFSLPQVGIDHQRFRAGGPHRHGGLFQIGAVSGDQNQRGEVAREADGGRLADALAGAGDDGN
jgi:hypothetical protein